MKRREFIVNTTSAIASVVGARVRAAVPCPPPALAVDSQNSVATACKELPSDWSTRSVEAGVFYANNFTYKNAVGDPIASDSDLRAACSAINGTASTIAWDTANKLSGRGALRLNLPASSPGVYATTTWDFAGIASTSKSVVKHQFYLQWSTYADATWRNFYYGDNSTYGGKIIIVECYNSSYDPGEVVIKRWCVPGGFVKGYRFCRAGFKGPSATPWEFGLHWSAYSDYTRDTFLDAGMPTVTDPSTLRQRYGIDYLTEQSSTGDNPDYQWVPRLVENGWTTHELYIDQVNDVIKYWMAPYGSPPTLVLGAMTAGLPGVGTYDQANLNPQPLYTGFQLTTYPNTAANWPSTDTYVMYDEVIASDSPITFPGGYTLPNPGAVAPAGYPPMGATET